MARFYRLGELVEATGVSARTVRYYIAEGLLPPPRGAGPAAVYTAAHRDRLRLIAAWKAQYLSLREVGRRLAALSDAQVRAQLQAEEATDAAPPPDVPPAPPIASPRPAPRAAQVPPLPASAPTPAPAPAAASRVERWERITLADGVELHIREDHRQERILLDALVRQARALLGEP